MTRRFASLQARLSLISLLTFAMIAAFGLLTIRMFNQVNVLTDELRQVWLPSTRLLGDLNNATSDDRAAEGDALLASDEAARVNAARQIARLHAAVIAAKQAYERIPHSPEEVALYQRFRTAWEGYTAQVARVLGLAGSVRQEAAVALYRTGSRAAYDAASDALGALTNRTVEAARDASARTAQAYAVARWLILAALLLAGTLLIAALAYIRRFLSRPLVEMAATMHRLAENDTGIALPDLDRNDEIGEMSRALRVFRANAIALIESRQGLAQQAAMLEQKLALEQQLTQMQRNFVVMVSHEFRTPLTIIDAHAQRLIGSQQKLPLASLAERAGRIRFAVQRMTNLMDNLLTTGRMIDGPPDLFFSPSEFDLPALLHEVCVFHRETAPSAHIGEDYRHGPSRIFGDRKLLFQAFSNLLSNAIKYSGDQVFIDIALTRGDGKAMVAVRDRGIGVAAADLPSLFTRYYRGSNAQGFVGTGVGLYLVKTVAALHGGDVLVESTEGVGSCFTLWLPERGAAAG